MNTQQRDALVMVLSRNSFYKRLHYLMLSILLMAIIVIGLLVAVLAHLIRHASDPLYFATDPVGRLVQEVPLEKPNMSLDDVIAWTENAVQLAYSFDFVNYRAQLQTVENYFTPYGWRNYMKGMVASNNIVAIYENKEIILAQIVEKPNVLAQGILGGAYAWKFEMNMLAKYLRPPFDSKSYFANSLVLTVIVQRQPILQSKNGLGIVQLIASIPNVPANAPQTISNVPTN